MRIIKQKITNLKAVFDYGGLTPASQIMNEEGFSPLCSFPIKAMLICGLFLLLSSCLSPRYSLNRQERAFVQKSSKYEIYSIYYDKAAIRNLRTDGIYTVETNRRGLSDFDENETLIKVAAIEIAYKVVDIMNFKEHHQFIEVVLLGRGADNYRRPIEYEYRVRMPVSNVKQATLIRSMTTLAASDIR